MNVIGQIRAYRPYNIQEEKDKENILRFLETHEDAFERTNQIAHMTASAWVCNPARDRILMAYHRIYDSWSWLGGHADGERDLRKVSLKELREESGLSEARLLSDRIYSLEVLTVDGHEKNGEYLSSHLHLNITYLFEADPDLPLSVREEENSAVSWFSLEDSLRTPSEK